MFAFATLIAVFVSPVIAFLLLYLLLDPARYTTAVRVWASILFAVLVWTLLVLLTYIQAYS
ncbi:hypothetical protein Q5741_12885 [Paenibacillus sp. JX-17]|uniref:Uncharacterized protein n=1 Tax=Paenibacillus lacisoli TaxID=3064525 RepID=A0ABT9CH91_9BACL|nr:hypothetical protein [Paenibacillus sp. JX-17]MDO7907302.1 hypothetical protein [Paenibacillus sp. JX-17]